MGKNIKDYLNLSTESLNVKDIFVSPATFKNIFYSIKENERNSYIRHFIVNNLAYIFRETPLFFENLKEYIAQEMDVSTSEIIMIGSGKTGFSMSLEKYGKPFSEDSDLDLSIINENLFKNLSVDFEQWTNDYERGVVQPSNEIEKEYWEDNKIKVRKNIENFGFIDTYKVPSRLHYKTVQNINNRLYIIGYQLEKRGILGSKKVSLRVYKDWNLFLRRVYLNTKHGLGL